MVQELTHTFSQPAFTVDRRGCISAWNPPASRLLGYEEREVTGRRCFQVLQAVKAATGVPCRHSCPLLGTAHRTATFQSTVLSVKHAAGRTMTLLSVMVGKHACRSRAGLVFLRPAAGEEVMGLLGHATLQRHFGETVVPLPEIVQAALEDVLSTAHVEAAELFLQSVPDGTMELVDQRGKDTDAFTSITSFRPGEGFPGLVAVRREPIITAELPRDDRYLRVQVKSRGYSTYACAPVRVGDRVVGSLNIATRRPELDLPVALSRLGTVAQGLGVVLELACHRVARTAVLLRPVTGTGTTMDLSHFLKTMAEAIGASDGAVFLYDRPDRSIRPVAVYGHPDRCLAVASRCPVALHRRPLWTEANAAPEDDCPGLRDRGKARICLPLEPHNPLPGVLSLGIGKTGTLPCGLSALLALAVRQEPGSLLLGEQLRQMQFPPVGAESDRHVSPTTIRLLIPRADVASPTPGISGPAGPVAASRPPTTDREAGCARHLHIRCLGPFRVLVDGEPLSSARLRHRHHALTLLKLLVTYRGRPVARDMLADILWPEASPVSGLRNLKVAVHALRRAIEPCHEAPFRYITRQANAYLFNTSTPHYLDVDEFLASVRTGEDCEASRDTGGAIRAYELALSLYEGDYLEDDLYADWCVPERERLRTVFVTTVDRLAGLLQQRGEFEVAAACLRRGLQVDPLREEFHRALMHVLWRLGRRDEAIRQYNLCSELLLQELGVEPEKATRELLRRLVH